MSNLRVNNTTFNYPDPGSAPGWGEAGSDWAKAVTDALNTLQGPGTINETQAALENNVTIAKSITGLAFAPALTKEATVEYRIQIVTDSESRYESGTIKLLYKPDDITAWEYSRVITAGVDAGVVITIDPTGQGKYVTENVAGANYSGFIIFKTTNVLR
jgi:hypothetical protein